MADHRFCVTHVFSGDAVERFGAIIHFGDLDPGKEAARMLIAAKVRRSTTTSVSVDDYDVGACGEIIPDAVFEVEADAETMGRLISQIGSGRVQDAAVTAIEIASGITVKTVKEVGRGARKLERIFRRLRKKLFG